jgi:hypothetical protein
MIHGTRGQTHILYSNTMTRQKGCALGWSQRVKMSGALKASEAEDDKRAWPMGLGAQQR